MSIVVVVKILCCWAVGTDDGCSFLKDNFYLLMLTIKAIIIFSAASIFADRFWTEPSILKYKNELLNFHKFLINRYLSN